MKREALSVDSIEVVLNKRVLLSMLIVTGISILLSGCLAYIFSDSLFTIFCGLVIGVTIGVVINYFLVTSRKIVKQISVKLSKNEDTEDLCTVMKIE
jgi:ABC-type lipoprotein release transport system permease subunit